MKSTRAVLVAAVVLVPVLSVTSCSRESDGPPTAPVALPTSAASRDISSSAVWSAPTNLGSVLNSASNETGPVISRNGLSLYFSSDRAGGSGGGDIWVAKREHKNDAWGVPVNLGPTVNSPVSDNASGLSRDGHHLFFSSARTGGFGATDIWVSFRPDVNDDFGWQSPVNIGSAINTSFNEAGAFLTRASGKEVLYFNSNRPGGPGLADIFTSTRNWDGSFNAPARVVELNSSAVEASAEIRNDGREIFFYSNRAGSLSSFDLWTSTRRNPRAPWLTPTNLGTVVNTTFVEQTPDLSRDARTLIFASNRPGGFGLFDLYVTTRGGSDDDDDDDDDDDN